MGNPKHTLTYIKCQAKKIKKERGITHTDALEIVSKQCGYSNWMHCHRSLNQEKTVNAETVIKSVGLDFTDWLKRHTNRNSPLGDLAKDVIKNENWPVNNSLDDHRSYLLTQKLPYGALDALNRAWKSYGAYLKKKNTPNLSNRTAKRPELKKYDQRKIVYISDATPIHCSKRTVEKFARGDKAWVSWNGRKAIPVTITEVDDRHYSFKIERPVRKAGDSYFLFLDEVRSTPELACMNRVTL